MASIRYSEVRKGMVIVGEDGQLYYCVDRELKTPGNLPSKLTLRLKNAAKKTSPQFDRLYKEVVV